MGRNDTIRGNRTIGGSSSVRRSWPLKSGVRPRVSLYGPQHGDVAVTVVTALILLLILALTAVL